MHSVIVNGEGNVMEVVYASGRKVTYRPHNCSRVIGECEYMLSRNDGAPERRRSRAVMSGGVREGMLFDDRGFIMVESRITFDADWVAVRMVRRQPNTTDPRWSVRELVEVIPPKP
ncbi:hypothetical protein ACFQFQ_09470 [Sulfitobacter porphyrae]|uniref:Uncharacterized protein n=1 Tax=Sulfitobacter porphyrae TaxID=1246864 RepID=A0ABW2B278_9RHOB